MLGVNTTYPCSAMRFDWSANACRKPSPSVRLMTAGSAIRESGRVSRASTVPSGVRISRFCSIILALRSIERAASSTPTLTYGVERSTFELMVEISVEGDRLHLEVQAWDK